MIKNQKGITLIALVITIIVLLILAGVSIAMLTGDYGMLTQAGSARNETAKAEAVERINVALNAAKTEIYKQQVDTPNWKPVTQTGSTYELNGDAIKNIIETEGFGTTNGSGKYYYELTTTGVLKLSYYNDTPNVGSSENPIEGTLDLSTSPYTIKAAAIK